MQNAVRVLQIVPLGAGGITSLILGVEEHMDRSMVAFDYMTFYDRKELPNNLLILNVKMKIPHVIFLS